MPILAPLMCLVLAALQLGERRPAPEITFDDRVPDEASLPHREPADLHLGTFTSELCARLGTDGSFDTGAGVLRFSKRAPGDGEAWQPLTVRKLRFGRGPQLWGTFFDAVDGAFVTLRGTAVEVGPAGDRRVQLGVQIAFENPTPEAHTVRLRAELSPGGAAGTLRPSPDLPFDPGAVFALDDGFVTRDGTALLHVERGGQQPEVSVQAGAGGPDEAVASFEWSVSLAPGEALGAALHLSGASTAPQDGRDEAAWREAFVRFSYRRLEELANWQSDVRPTYIKNRLGDVRVVRGMLASIHYLRALGHADQVLHVLTDRPFNQPPSDAAVEGPMIGSMLEWGLVAFAHERHAELVLSASVRVGSLPPERRVAYLDGLARGARLFQQHAHDLVLAEAILELVEPGTAVPCWSDPEEVRAAFQGVVERAGLFERVDEVPELAWAEPEPGSVAAHAVAVRKALAAGDPRGAWTALQPILDSTSIDGMGSMQAGAPYDGTFPVMLMSLVRALLVDDFGAELHVLPGLVEELVPYSGRLTLAGLETSFGELNCTFYWSLLGRVFSGQTALVPWGAPSRVLIHAPDPYRARAVKMQQGSGRLVLAPDGLLEWEYVPRRPLEFNIAVGRPER